MICVIWVLNPSSEIWIWVCNRVFGFVVLKGLRVILLISQVWKQLGYILLNFFFLCTLLIWLNNFRNPAQRIKSKSYAILSCLIRIAFSSYFEQVIFWVYVCTRQRRRCKYGSGIWKMRTVHQWSVLQSRKSAENQDVWRVLREIRRGRRNRIFSQGISENFTMEIILD